MTPVEELLVQIRDTNTPDKKRILRTRLLADQVGRDIADRAAARALVQQLNNAYLVLQLSTLSEDPAMARTCRAECLALAAALERARATSAARGSAAPAAASA
jgi:hypothetical protein